MKNEGNMMISVGNDRDKSATTMILTKEEAYNQFALSDNETVPINSCQPVKLSALKPTSTIIITGYIPTTASRFSVNLVCKVSSNIALHFNPRLDRDYVVRNSKIKGNWDYEETCSATGPQGYPFKRNSYFHLMIFCTQNEFQIAVNGEHFCAFGYRLPLEDVSTLDVNGDVEEVRLRQTVLFVYPDLKICKPLRNLAVKISEPVEEDLGVPVNIDIASPFNYGSRIFIKGRLKLLPHSFYINLQKGKLIYPHPEVALHLNPRFLYGNNPPCVVMNCWTNGNWSNEERHEGQLSWGPGRDFLLTIRCESSSYTIWLENRMIGEFRHRLDPSIVDTLRITGDVVLHQVAMSYNKTD